MVKFDVKQWLPGVINAFVLFSIVALIASINFIIDPFALNRRFNFSIEKTAISFKLSYYNWKFAEFKNSPAPVVLFGDSRTESLPEEEFARELNQNTYNFAFGGGNGFDVIDAFWFAASQQELQHIYVGLNALILNDHNRVRRARQALEVMEVPFRYYMSPLVTQASFKVILYNFFGVNLVSERPPMSEEQFWRYQLATAPGQMFADYAYPDSLLSELKKVAQFCDDEGIELTFMILPTHVDLQARRDDFQIVDGYRRSIEALREMGTVFDWDYPNEITTSRASFRDPFHMMPEVASIIAKELASGNPTLAR